MGDVDGDGKKEIVTGGFYGNAGLSIAQLCIWSGSQLDPENVKTWYWDDDTGIYSIAVGDLNGDSKTEIITGGYFNDGARNNAQLCVWT